MGAKVTKKAPSISPDGGGNGEDVSKSIEKFNIINVHL